MAWAFEDKFNSDTKSTGDLNGQDSWTGGTGYDVTSSVSYEGGQSVTGNATNQDIEVSFTGVASGKVYFAFMKPDATGNIDMRFYSGANFRTRFQLNGGSLYYRNNETDTVWTTYTNSQWYVIEFDFDAAGAGTYNARYHDGTSWSTAITGIAIQGTAANIDKILFNQGASGVGYWDTITPTDPTGGVAAVVYSQNNLTLLGIS